MRPNQQNRRMRGRGNRKSPNPLTRSYESNGPDVKIRGSAQQIADKYSTLARDAQASGDRVMAENYLQHAEHYNRIIAAAQSQQQAQRESREEQEESRDQDREQPAEATGTKPAEAQNDDGSGPQPVINGTPAEVALEEQTVAGDDAGKGEKRPAKPARRPRRPRKDDAVKARGDEAGEETVAKDVAKDVDGADEGSTLAATGS